MWPRIRHYLGYHRVPISFGLGVVFWMLASPTWRSIAFGLPIVVAGEGLRIWSSGTLEKNVAIASAGPYAYTRNPLYLGNFLIGLGFVLMGHNPWLVGLFLVAFPVIYVPTVLEEERFLRGKFGEPYEAYLRRVPRFFPTLSVTPQRTGRFRWGLVKDHREYRTLYGLGAGLAAVLLRAILVA